MTQEDDETEDEPVSLYCPTESEGYADQGGVVFVKNEESPVESIPLLRRHVVMPRESEGLDISSVTRSDKRGVAGVGLVRQLPVVHSIESNRMEGKGDSVCVCVSVCRSIMNYSYETEYEVLLLAIIFK